MEVSEALRGVSGCRTPGPAGRVLRAMPDRDEPVPRGPGRGDRRRDPQVTDVQKGIYRMHARLQQQAVPTPADLKHRLTATRASIEDGPRRIREVSEASTTADDSPVSICPTYRATSCAGTPTWFARVMPFRSFPRKAGGATSRPAFGPDHARRLGRPAPAAVFNIASASRGTRGAAVAVRVPREFSGGNSRTA